MKRRFAVGKTGEFEDRDGHSLGRVTNFTFDNKLGRVSSITLDVPAEWAAGGTIGGAAPTATTESHSTTDGGVGEGALVVWQHYVEVMEPRNKELDGEARKIIGEALKVATADECKRAIDGCAASPYHMGQNARQRKYNKLTHILKSKRAGQFGQGRTTREQVDFFMDLADKAGLHPGLTSADPARVRQAKRSVMDAWEYPGNDDAVANGEEERAWLEQQGIKVLEDPSERNRHGTPKPRFEVQV